MNLMFPDRRIYEISVGDYVEGRKGFNVWVMFGETHPYWRDPEDREEEILHIRTGEIPFVVWRGISYDVLKTDDGLGYLLSEPKAVSVS